MIYKSIVSFTKEILLLQFFIFCLAPLLLFANHLFCTKKISVPAPISKIVPFCGWSYVLNLVFLKRYFNKMILFQIWISWIGMKYNLHFHILRFDKLGCGEVITYLNLRRDIIQKISLETEKSLTVRNVFLLQYSLFYNLFILLYLNPTIHLN
jgi:hypothetical protein